MKNLLDARNLSTSEFKNAKKLNGFDAKNYKYNSVSRSYEKINLLKSNKDMSTNTNSKQNEATGKKVPATSTGKTAPIPKADENKPSKEELATAKATAAVEKVKAKAKIKQEKADAKATAVVEKAKVKQEKIDAKIKAKADAKKNKKSGVIASIYEFLGKRPQTTAKIAARLFERFPDKTISSLTGTINCQIGTDNAIAKHPAKQGYKVEMTVKGTGKEKIKSFTGVKIQK